MIIFYGISLIFTIAFINFKLAVLFEEQHPDKREPIAYFLCFLSSFALLYWVYEVPITDFNFWGYCLAITFFKSIIVMFFNESQVTKDGTTNPRIIVIDENLQGIENGRFNNGRIFDSSNNKEILENLTIIGDQLYIGQDHYKISNIDLRLLQTLVEYNGWPNTTTSKYGTPYKMCITITIEDQDS